MEAGMMAHATPYVRPYALRDLLDDSFDLYRERAVSLTLVGLSPFIPVLVIAYLMRSYFIPENFFGDISSQAAMMEGLRALFTNGRFWTYLAVMGTLGTLATGTGYLWQCRIAVRQALGEDSSTRASGKGLFLPLLSLLFVETPIVTIISQMVAAFAMGAFLFIGAMIAMLVVLIATGTSHNEASTGYIVGITVLILLGVAVIFSVALTCAVLAFVLPLPVSLVEESPNPFTALGRSFKLVSANYKAQFIALYAFVHFPIILYLLAFILVGLLFLAIRLVFPTFEFSILITMSQMIALALTTALFACFQTLCYLDGRCRVESYDLALLADRIGLGKEFREALVVGAATPAFATVSAHPNYLAAPASDSSPLAAPQQRAVPLLTTVDYSQPPPPLATLTEPEVVPQETPDAP
jgi:hypothetical protein